GTAADEAGNDLGERVEACAAGLAGGDLVADVPRRQLCIPAGDAGARHAGLVRLAVAVPAVEALLPGFAVSATLAPGRPVQLEHVVVDLERPVRVEAEDLLGDAD